MNTFRTFSGPRASTQSFVTVAESTPPLSPTTTPLHPIFWTVLLMNPVRSATSSSVI